jgi:thiosulfate dehydrogenase
MRFILLLLCVIFLAIGSLIGCGKKGDKPSLTAQVFKIDTSKIPNDSFGLAVRYGMKLMYNTAEWLGPDGKAGQYLNNYMNCTNCHQEAGTKPYAYPLVMSHTNYPQYRSREDKVLTLADRVNNCVERPHNGKSLPLGSKEMTGILSYLYWLNKQLDPTKKYLGIEPLEITLINRQASSQKGAVVYQRHCERCHGLNGEGVKYDSVASYTYPPLWGDKAYQAGSSMHRVMKMARWLKANMPHEQATYYAPILADEECMDVAAFVNDDSFHRRPKPTSFDYPNIKTKPLDFGKGPYIDPFSELQHKFGPYQPIVDWYKKNGLEPKF